MIDLLDDRGIQGSLESIYGPTVVDHISHPRNLGVLDHATSVGTIDDVETENLVIVYVLVEGNQIRSASFRAIACSACIAAASMATVLLTDRLLELGPLRTNEILDGLGGLPKSKVHCAEIAARAANLAIGGS